MSPRFVVLILAGILAAGCTSTDDEPRRAHSPSRSHRSPKPTQVDQSDATGSVPVRKSPACDVGRLTGSSYILGYPVIMQATRSSAADQCILGDRPGSQVIVTLYLPEEGDAALERSRSGGQPVKGVGEEAYRSGGLITALEGGKVYTFSVRIRGRSQPEQAARTAAWSFAALADPDLFSYRLPDGPRGACRNYVGRADAGQILGGPVTLHVIEGPVTGCRYRGGLEPGSILRLRLPSASQGHAILAHAQDVGTRPPEIQDPYNEAYQVGNRIVVRAGLEGVFTLAVVFAGHPDPRAAARLVAALLAFRS